MLRNARFVQCTVLGHRFIKLFVIIMQQKNSGEIDMKIRNTSKIIVYSGVGNICARYNEAKDTIEYTSEAKDPFSNYVEVRAPFLSLGPTFAKKTFSGNSDEVTKDVLKDLCYSIEDYSKDAGINESLIGYGSWAVKAAGEFVLQGVRSRGGMVVFAISNDPINKRGSGAPLVMEAALDQFGKKKKGVLIAAPVGDIVYPLSEIDSLTMKYPELFDPNAC